MIPSISYRFKKITICGSYVPLSMLPSKYKWGGKTCRLEEI